MNKETIKELRERADEMISAGIANKDALFAALPVITGLQAKVESAKKNLATLPEKWRKQKIELSTSGINEDGPTDAELAERGLAAKVRNIWSLVEE